MKKQTMDISVRPVFWVLFLVAVTVSAYANSFRGAFLLDDYTNILEYEKVHTLAWPWEFMLNVRRPLLYLTIAWDYALGGNEPWGYHVFNLAVHVLAGLTVWAIIRRSWRLLPGCRGAREADSFAALAAAVWLVHPLQTQSVTYIVQRAESLMGLFYLLSWYAAIRYFFSVKICWVVLAGVSAVLSGLTKEVAVTIPLLVLLYDRAYFSTGFRAAVIRHRGLYLAFVPLWGVLAYLFFFTQPEIIPTAGFSYHGTPWLEYAASQPGVVLHYLRLIIFPRPLVFDYGWPLATQPVTIVMPLLLIWVLLSRLISLYRRCPQVGF